VAIVATKLPTGDWTVIEAVGRGVVVGRLSAIAPGGSYAVARVPGAEPARVVAFAKSQVGREYGWLTILSVVVGILTPRWFHLPSFRTDRSWICSALGGEAARFGGWLHDWPTVYGVLPSELFAAIVAKAG
jgi:hypothetical protein